MVRQRYIMHVDMDAFFASVEQLDHPEYRGKPVIVGGLSGRGVVSTSSYEARKFGVHSAMPMATAHRLCPQAIFVQGRYARYQEVSGEIRKIFQEFSPLVEPLSIDEAFLDLTGMEALAGDVYALGPKIKQVIRERTGLTASVGLAPNKFLAKLASDLRKPDGLVIIRPEEAATFIVSLPVGRIFGLGQRSVAALEKIGIRTIGQLAACDPRLLQPLLGKQAKEIRDRARGLDNRPVVPDEQRKSLGKENTFPVDLVGLETCLGALWDLCQQVGWRLRCAGLSGCTVTLKVKTGSFQLLTRSRTVEDPLSQDEELMEQIRGLARQLPWNQPVRLLGVSVSHLVPAGSQSLALEDERQQNRNRALDALKQRFGEDIIRKGWRNP
ncbi:DNA polymerase IV [Acidaminococcus fermentans]|uniref:DNA polymerase IV n=1 Tax=Acidaminococcus fermentans TaxID=905 RepID=UPI002431FFE3|nr:DNA polymerase IV [Acidaminococcus fermentans]